MTYLYFKLKKKTLLKQKVITANEDVNNKICSKNRVMMKKCRNIIYF